MGPATIQALKKSCNKAAFDYKTALRKVEATLQERGFTNYLVDPLRQFSGLPFDAFASGDFSVQGGNQIQRFSTKAARANARRLRASGNPYVASILKNSVAYTVGQRGMTWDVIAREDMKADKESEPKAFEEQEKRRKQLKRVIRRLRKKNKFKKKERALVTEPIIDGEVFLRLTPATSSDGYFKIRFLDPSMVQTPASRVSMADTDQGVRFRGGDVEDVIGYYYRGEFVDGQSVIHEKWNVTPNTLRGVSELHWVSEALEDACALRQAMTTIQRLQASIAMIREHDNGTLMSKITELADRDADVVETSDGFHDVDFASISVDFDKRRQKFVDEGSMLDVPPGMKLSSAPFANLDISKGVAVHKMVIREIGAGIVMAPFMIGADQDSKGFGSSGVVVAQGPVHMRLLMRQADTADLEIELYEKTLDRAADLGEVPEDWEEEFEVTVIGPEIITEDGLKEAQKHQVLVQNKIESKKTARASLGLDDEQETMAIQEEAASALGAFADPFPPLPMPTTEDE